MLRLLRLRSFWLGLPGLIFLLWAWHGSSRYSASAFLSVGTMREWVESSHSSITLKHIPGGPFPTEWKASVQQKRLSRTKRSGLFPKAFSATGSSLPDVDGDFDPPTLQLAYWLLVLLYSAPWTALLGLLWRAPRSA